MGYLWQSMNALDSMMDALTSVQIVDNATGTALGHILTQVTAGEQAVLSYWASEIMSLGPADSEKVGQYEAYYGELKTLWDNTNTTTTSMTQQAATNSQQDASAQQQVASFVSFLQQTISYINSLLQQGIS